MGRLKQYILSIKGILIISFGLCIVASQLLCTVFSHWITNQALSHLNPRPDTYLMDSERVVYVYNRQEEIPETGIDLNQQAENYDKLNRYDKIRSFAPFPVYSSCIILTVLLFYRLKMKRPLALLMDAADKISNQDLDFTIKATQMDELGQLIETVEHMRFELSKAFKELWDAQERRRMLYQSYSHDLRTPLCVIKGNNELIEMSALDSGLTEVIDAVESSKHAITRMETYAFHLKELSMAEQLSLSLALVDMQAFTEKLSGQLAALAAGSGKTMSITNNASTGYFDEDSVVRILDNLLDNALRFSKQKVTVETINKGAEIIIQIQDDGPGFDTQSLANATKPFYTSDKSRGHFGLGLAISDTLARQNKGTLLVSNKLEGALVSLVLKRFE